MPKLQSFLGTLILCCYVVTSSTFQVQGVTENERLASLYQEKVCIIVFTRLDADKWDDDWTDKFFKWIKAVLLRSIDRQCTSQSPCPLLDKFKVLVRIDGRLDERNRMIMERVKHLTNVISYVGNDMSNVAVAETWIARWVARSKCAWVSYIWIDADDVFMDGFFLYVTTRIPKLIAEKKGSWRGAMFIVRDMLQLIVGNNRCEVGEYDGYVPQRPFFCGLSPGQGLMLRREVWDLLPEKILPFFLHIHFLKVVRVFVMNGLGYTEYSTETCGKGHFHVSMRIAELQNSYENYDASRTGIFTVDLKEDWITSGIWVQTPFSSHFPWAFYDTLPVCSPKQVGYVEKEFPQDIGFVLEAAKGLHISLEECCANNRYLTPGLRDHPGCELLHNRTKNLNHT